MSRWSVTITKLDKRETGYGEEAAKELEIFMTDEQAHWVRLAVLNTLAANESRTFIGEEGKL